METDGMIKGKRIILRPRRRSDAAFFVHWYNQPRIMFQCGFTQETTLAQEEETLESAREDSVWFTITDLDGTIIGETGLLRMFPEWHCTDLSIIIPDPESQGHGYGKEAIMLMIQMAFDRYDMNRIAIGVVGKNAEALRFYEKTGFKQEGIQEQGYYWEGEYSDFVMMRLLRNEFCQSHLNQHKEQIRL